MNVFITGATGFLGGETLIELSKRKEINKIYCLMRAKSHEDGVKRLEKIFAVHNDPLDKNKVIPVLGDLLNENLANELIANPAIKDTNVIVHSAANTSFSPVYDDLVEKTNIKGLESILLWSKQLPALQTFTYIGTATICGKDQKNRIVKESESPNLQATHVVRYTYTKMMGELLLKQHLPEDKILVVRPSIIMGDSRGWVPRSTVILWTMATANLMRLIPVNANSDIDIISVDYAAIGIVKLIFAKRKYNVYHVSSGTKTATNSQKLTDAISKSYTDRPEFKLVHKDLINQMMKWAKRHGLKPDDELHNYADHLEYWKNTFPENGKLRILLFAMKPYLEFIELGQIFDNSRLMEDTDMGPCTPAHDYIVNQISYLENIDVFEGAIDF